MKLTNLLIVYCLITLVACKQDNCENTRCLNGGICIDGICSCPPGYSGDNCEIKDSCYNINCKNDGICVGGKCDCPISFWGVNCEKSNIYGKKYLCLSADNELGFKSGDTLDVYGYQYNNKSSIAFLCKVNNDWDFNSFGYYIGSLYTKRLSRYRFLKPEVSSDGNRLNFKVCDYDVPNPRCDNTVFEVIQ